VKPNTYEESQQELPEVGIIQDNTGELAVPPAAPRQVEPLWRSEVGAWAELEGKVATSI